MMKKFNLLLVVLLFALSAGAHNLSSPSGNLSLSFKFSAAGEPVYELRYKGRPVVRARKIGFLLNDAPPLQRGFTIVDAKTGRRDETWNPVWGEQKTIRNNYRELAVTLQQAVGFDPVAGDPSSAPKKLTRKMTIRFRLFDDGLGFRCEFPVQDELKYFTLTDEKTEFNLAGDHKTFWIPGDYDSNEYIYSTTKLSEIDANVERAGNGIAFRTPIGETAVQTP